MCATRNKNETSQSAQLRKHNSSDIAVNIVLNSSFAESRVGAFLELNIDNFQGGKHSQLASHMTLYSNPRTLQPRLWCCRGELRPKEASLALQLQRRGAEALGMINSQPPFAFLRGRFVTGFLTFKGILKEARKVQHWSRIGTHHKTSTSYYIVMLIFMYV